MANKRVYYPQCRVGLYFLPRGSRAETSELLAIDAVIPARASVKKNAPNKADEYTLEIDARHFPLDPQSVRAVLADVRMMTADGFSPDLRVQDFPRSLVIGYADEIETKINDQGATVQLKGKDYTGLFLDEKWGDRRVKLGQTFEAIIREAMDGWAPGGNLELVNGLDGPTPEVPQKPGKKGKRYAGDQKAKLWDVLHELGRRVGLILEVDGDKLRIREPKNVMPNVKLPVFVDGRNMHKLKLKRKIEGRDVPNVRCKSVDPRSGETVVGIYPDPPVKKVRISDGERNERISYHEYLIDHPAPTEKILKEVAKRVYEGWKQKELTVDFTTRELEVWEGRPQADVDDSGGRFDVTRLKNGVPVRIHLDRETRDILQRSATPAAKQIELKRRGYTAEVARALGEGWKELDKTFFVETARHQYKADNGYECKVSAVNALEV